MNIFEMSANTQEYDGSLNDFIERVRAEFEKQFPQTGVGNGGWYWVSDVFPAHVICRQGDQYYRIEMEVTEDAITFQPRNKWEPVKLSYVAEMPLSQFHDVLIISEFKGKYPDVPIADGIDYDELIEGDSDPVFVTLPVGKVNAKSGNKRFYDEAFVSELEKQILANKPIGLMGHLKPEQRATEFPMEAVHWVGAKRVGELLWGKGYVPMGDARARLQRYKATKKQIATSIDALAEGIWDETISAYRMKADTLKLAQIDIAPADRAGIADLAAVPHFTTEMSDSNGGNNNMDKAQAIRELTVEDINLLPEAVRNAILVGSVDGKVVTELRQILGLDAGADPIKAITELRQAEETRKKEAVKARITELASDKEKGVKLETVRGLVIELVTARNPATVQEAETVYQQVVETDAVKAALKGQLQETMGPPQRTPVAGQNGSNRYFNIPKKDAA